MTRKRLIIAVVICGLLFSLCLTLALSLDQLLPSPETPTLQGPTDPPTDAPTDAPTDPPTEPPTDAPTEAPTQPRDEIFTLTFVGDCTLGSMPAWMGYPSSYVGTVGTNYDLPFQYVAEYFRNDDYTFANLESVLADSGVPADKPYVFRGPTAFVNILTGSSVEFVSLANNHTYDFGAEGYKTTGDTLRSAGVSFVQSHCSAVVTTESGLKIGVYGVYFWVDMNDVRAEIAQMKEAGAEIIIAAAHWGDEGTYRANANQKAIAHALIDAGVDIVWGHHPHVLQPIEVYKDGIIYYSLGNFSYGGNHNPSDKDTAVLQQQVIRSPDGEISLGNLNIIPCQLSSVSWKNDFQPKPYAPETAAYERTMSKLMGSYTGDDMDLSYRDDYLDDYNKGEVTHPGATEPETTAPEQTEPETTAPEETESETTAPEQTESETTAPEETEPEVTEPEVHIHSYTTVWVEATCTTGGYNLHTCGCGHSYQSDNVAALGHSYGDWEITVEPTTESIGERRCVCTVCGDVKTETVPALDPETGEAYESYIDPRIEVREYPTNVAYKYGSCCVNDYRTTGAAPSIWVNEDGSLTVVYYQEDGTKVKVYVCLPPDEFIRQCVIMPDGSYRLSFIGDPS